MKLKYNFLSFRILVLTIMIIALSASISHAEILAMLNYESKPEQFSRREGIAIMDVDPDSPNSGKILMDIPLPHNLVNQSAGKTYQDITELYHEDFGGVLAV